MHRFIVRAAALAQDSVTLEAAHARQIAVVLRMQPGDEITLVAGGSEARASIESVSPERVVARIRDRIASATEPTGERPLALPLLRVGRSREAEVGVTARWSSA